MFLWSPRGIEFMRAASEYGNYYTLLAKHISSDISGKRVLDAGCGLGYLSLAMSPLCAHITAFDRDENALNVLKENIASREITNIEVCHGDMFAYAPIERYDTVVFCFFGGIEESLKLAVNCLKPGGKAILIKKAWTKHRFTLSGSEIQGHTLSEAEAKLTSLNIPYSLDLLELEMGQPFYSAKEAAEFFTIYDADGKTVAESDVASKLVPAEHGEYSLYLPSKKQIGVITIDINADILPAEK